MTKEKDDYLIKIDTVRLDGACDAFFKWKDLNTYIKSLVSRGINMPDAISEPIGCYCMDYYWNKSSSGDAKTIDGLNVEFKATSNYNMDLSSFGPKCTFDKLVFLRFDVDNNFLYVYDTKINCTELAKLPVSKTSTVGDYQKAGKRPHLSIIKTVIEPNNLEPDVVFNIRKGQIEMNNR